MKKFFAYFASLSRGQQRFLIALGILVIVPFMTLVGLQIYNAANLAILGSDIAARLCPQCQGGVDGIQYWLPDISPKAFKLTDK